MFIYISCSLVMCVYTESVNFGLTLVLTEARTIITSKLIHKTWQEKMIQDVENVENKIVKFE